MLHSLFHLPSDPTSIIFSFLTLSELSQVDIATTSKQHRKALYAVYELFTFASPVFVSCAPVLSWFVKRHIRVLHVVVKKKMSQCLLSEIFDMLSSHFIYLISLDLQSNPWLTSCILKKIFPKRSGVKIKEIDLSRCVAINDDALQILVDYYTYLGSITQAVVPTLSSSSSIQPSSLRLPIAGRATLASASASVSPKQNLISSSLLTIRLGFCNKITPIGLVSFLLSPASSSLQVLDISGCTGITDKIVEHISISCGSTLHTLYLNKCVHITDKSLESLALKCPHLHTLSVQFCGHITDAGVQLLTFSSPRQSVSLSLQSLNLSDCLSITDGSVLSIATNCNAKLTTLVLTGCLNISQHAIRVLKCAIPSLCPKI